jgi:C4-dicarboxylate-specific signal transduction histidine kinase
VSSLITNYSRDSKWKMMDKSAEMSASSLQAYLSLSGEDDIHTVISRFNMKISSNLDNIAKLADSTVYIIDTDGNLLASSDSSLNKKITF